jgi:TatD DNase family protein
LSFGNFYISFCGNVTYKNFDSMDAVENIPVNKILSETDTPFLPPIPYRGRKNEPAYIVHTIEKISAIKEISAETLKSSLYENAIELFF